MRVSMIVVVVFRVRTRRLRRIPHPPFPNSLSAPPVHMKAQRPTSISPSGSMLLLLVRHINLELSFGFSSNQPSRYCSEKRSLHPQLEKRTLLLDSLNRSASCDRLALPRKHFAQCSQRPVRAGRRRRFLSDRKYRYHPRTKADVADCWRWR